jgi:DNA-binding XRE family transcriptional regulator
VQPDLLAAIDEWAAQHACTRPEALRRLAKTGLETEGKRNGQYLWIRNDLKGSNVAQAGILAHQLKAARALARMDQQALADRSGVSVPTIKRMEAGDGPIRGNYENVAAVVAVLEASGIEFIPENGGGPGVRLRKPAAAPAVPSGASKTAPPKKTRPRRS